MQQPVEDRSGRAHQIVICNADGYILGEDILFHLAPDHFYLCGVPFAMNWIRYNAEKTELDVQFKAESSKDIAALAAAKDLLPSATRVNIAYLASEDDDLRVKAIQAVKRYGFIPVPHISARRLSGPDSFLGFLAKLKADQLAANLLVIGGDRSVPAGPYADALSVIRSNLLENNGVRSVNIAAHPEGHPAISEAELWQALEQKVSTTTQRGLCGEIINQFSFDADAVLAWIRPARSRGITLPIRVGVPGPVGIRRLIGFATRFGVGSNAAILRKYGLSLTNLFGFAGPDNFVHSLASQMDPARDGVVKLHFYTFGGLQATAQWVSRRICEDIACCIVSQARETRSRSKAIAAGGQFETTGRQQVLSERLVS